MVGGYTQEVRAGKTEIHSIEEYDSDTKAWKQVCTEGDHPPQAYYGAASCLKDCLYTYGGFAGNQKRGSLYRLDLKSQPLMWSLLSKMNAAPDGPKPKYGCAMVACDEPLSLILVGGFVPIGEITKGTQKGSCTDEIHRFNVQCGKFYLVLPQLNSFFFYFYGIICSCMVIIL